MVKHLYCQIDGGANWHCGTKIYISVAFIVLGSQVGLNCGAEVVINVGTKQLRCMRYYCNVGKSGTVKTISKVYAVNLAIFGTMPYTLE